MKQKLLIFGALIFLVIILIGLNAASYVQKDKVPDSESKPNRSTYNSGVTGTRVFYDLLAETGRRPVRWQEPPSALLNGAAEKNAPRVFVVVGSLRRDFDDTEIEQLLRWVSSGGRLVVIDREPPAELIKTTSNWRVLVYPSNELALFNVDPTDQKQMTENTQAAKPTQPTVYTSNVNAVQPSRFASSIWLDFAATESDIKKKRREIEDSFAESEADETETIEEAAPKSGSDISFREEIFYDSSAPIAQLANDKKTLLVDFPYGAGEIAFLSDPYIVSNGGIGLVDNAQLAINLVNTPDGVIAFDEYHQGYGAGESRLLEYFSGTPLLAILLQIAALVGFVLFTQSRRFARPLPETEPNRLSKLEYVSAMAELQQRTRAFDLAMENIYTDFRRRVSRLVGADNFTVSPKELSLLIGERAKINPAEIENLMFKCEEIIRGEPTDKREIVYLTSRLREVEAKLGLQRRKRK